MTTTRDAIGLSERLRDPNAAYTEHSDGDPDLGRYIRWLKSLGKEAATALDALQARVKELEADRDRWKRHAQDETETAIAVHFELRTKLSRAEQERDKLQGMLLLCGELGGIGKDETPVAYLRRLIDGLIDVGRERDEAYERAAKVAEGLQCRNCNSVVPSGDGIGLCCGRPDYDSISDVPDAIRRLAAGTEKEKGANNG